MQAAGSRPGGRHAGDALAANGPGRDSDARVTAGVVVGRIYRAFLFLI
jgi:hypothetical protein